MRPAWYIVAFLAAAAVFIPTINLSSHDLSWADAVTGSVKREHVSIFGHSSGAVTEASPLEQYLRRSGKTWTPQWCFLHDVGHGLFGGRSYECGSAPPIYELRPLLKEFVAGSSDDDLRRFVDVMRSGSEAEQKSAVDAAGQVSLQSEAARTGG